MEPGYEAIPGSARPSDVCWRRILNTSVLVGTVAGIALMAQSLLAAERSEVLRDGGVLMKSLRQSFDATYDEDLLACSSYDDDGNFPAYDDGYGVNDCPNTDNTVYCDDDSSLTGVGTTFHRVCSVSCTGNSSTSWAMACAWEAIASLPKLCNGTFVAGLPNDSSDRPAGASNMTTLHPCDEHGFCYSCSTGADGLTRGNSHCRAVARLYGGLSYLSGTVGGTKLLGATTAFYALNDLETLCKTFGYEMH